jgi:hypothetical protein
MVVAFADDSGRQPGNPNMTYGNTNFGKIITTGGDPRIMQLAVKYRF